MTTSHVPQVQQLFPAAPSNAIVPDSARALRRARLARLRVEHRFTVGALASIAVAGIIMLAVVPIAGIAAIAACGLVALITHSYVSSQAENEFYRAYAAARGLREQEGMPVPAALPILRRGTRRTFGNMLAGSLLGPEGQLGHYTYYTEHTDGDGNRSETPHPHTVLHVPLPDAVAARYPGVYGRRKGWLGGGRLFDGVLPDRAVETEYHDFNRTYALRVIDNQDDVALYELLSTTFLYSLASNPIFVVDDKRVQWEQEGRDLLVFVEARLATTTQLDGLVTAAALIYTRYCEEYR